MAKIDLKTNLEKLSQIAQWFENQEEIDIEVGLEKVKEASILLKESKKRLKEIENEFIQIEKTVNEANDKKEKSENGPDKEIPDF